MNPALGYGVVKSDEQSKWSRAPDCLSGRTGHGLFTCLPHTLLILAAFLAPMAQAVETNSLTASRAPAIHRPTPGLQDIAAAYERTGRKREAASLYEAMVRTNPAARKVLSHRLVAIYAETGETHKALAWAREVMRDNPDPQAYLAAVQARLGQWQEAQQTLAREITRNTNATRAVTLRWQLAEVFEKAGDRTNAKTVLNDAAGAAKGTPMEPAARQRLRALKELGK